MMRWAYPKDGIGLIDYVSMNPALLLIFSFVSNFCAHNGIKFVPSSIGRTHEKNKALGSVSTTHVYDKNEGVRAFDLSLRSEHGWNEVLINEMLKEVEENFKHLGAFNSTSEIRTAVRHDNGNGDHVHFQVRRNLYANIKPRFKE
jgi:hypothetical protein